MPQVAGLARWVAVSSPHLLDVADPQSDEYADHIAEAVRALGDGRLAVIPTDTVYGIAADAFSHDAVGALLAAKGRGRDYPVPVLVGDPGVLHGLVSLAPESASALTRNFWPGALTVIVRYAPSLAWDLGDTAGTVAVRMPDNPVALDVLRKTGPLAVSSANKHGRPPGRTAALAAEQLGDTVDVYLEAGEVSGGQPSTIVDCTGERAVVVREGGVTLAEIKRLLPTAISAGA